MIEDVIKDITDLRENTVERSRGYFYIPSTEDIASRPLDIDSLDILRDVKPFEVDLKKTANPVDATNPYYLDYYYNPNYSSKEYEGYLLENYLPDGWEVGAGFNTCNWMGPVTNALNVTEIEDPEGHQYLIVRIHRWGDLRVNYTDDVLLDMDIEEFYELESLTKYETIEVDGVEYDLRISALSEGIEVNEVESGEYIGDIYSTYEDEAMDEIRELVSGGNA